MPKVNEFSKVVIDKLATNKNKIKVNFKQIQEQFNGITKAGEKLAEKTNPIDDKFIK